MTLALDHPWALALVPLPLLVRFLLPAYREQSVALRMPFLRQLAGAGAPSPDAPRAGPLRLVLAAIAWVLLVLAVAAPVRIEPPVTRESGGRDVLLALDLSGSMETQDMAGLERGKTSRLDAARAVLKEFIGHRKNDRLGLIVFGTAAFVLAPFTHDHKVLTSLLDETTPRMAGPQTMIGDAIGLAARTFERAQVGGRLLVLLTDGNDTGSRVPPERAAEIAGRLGVKIYTVSLGDPATAGEAVLDIPALEEIARATGGAHFHANDPSALSEIYRRIDGMEQTPTQTQSWRPRTPLFTWPLGGFALLAGLLLLLPGLQIERLGFAEIGDSDRGMRIAHVELQLKLPDIRLHPVLAHELHGVFLASDRAAARQCREVGLKKPTDNQAIVTVQGADVDLNAGRIVRQEVASIIEPPALRRIDPDRGPISEIPEIASREQIARVRHGGVGCAD